MEGFASFASLSSGFRVRDALKARTEEKGRYAMKSRFSTCIPAMMLFAALAIPVRLATQDRPDHRSKRADPYVLPFSKGNYGGSCWTCTLQVVRHRSRNLAHNWHTGSPQTSGTLRIP